jgi:flagellar biosynthesis protein FliQ
MTPETAITIGQSALTLTSIFIALLLLPALGIGLLVSMFQAATQINEHTLSFIPKLFAVLAMLFIGGHWILQNLIHFTIRLFSDIPVLIG